MSTATAVEVVGTPLDRVDGRLKVMGAATYSIDVVLPGLVHAVLVQSTATSGRIRHIAVHAAERAPGVRPGRNTYLGIECANPFARRQTLRSMGSSPGCV
jgi:hypothetical protein